MLYLLGALAGGIGIDWLFGDPPNKYHPVVWLGQLIGFFLPMLKGSSEKAKGTIFAISLVIMVALAVHFLVFASRYLAGLIELVIVSAIIFKITIAMKGMERHTKAIVNCLEARDLEATRHNLSMIVRRKTDGLDEQHILSATIECISESTVDGITGPIFYYSLFGPAGAFAYKTFSLNAGYPMATMAGALRIRLEKIGHYTLGDNQEPVTLEKCRKAISIMKLTTLLFYIVVSVPVVSVLYLAGWWGLVLGIP